MAKTPKKTTKSKGNRSARKKSKISLKKPSFASAKLPSTPALKKEKSTQSPHCIKYEILLDTNCYIFWVEKPSGEASYMQPLSDIVEDDNASGRHFRQHTRILAPLLSRRTSREDHTPLPSKHYHNVKRGQPNYPFRCLFGMKDADIKHEDCVTCVMDAIATVIKASSNYPIKFHADLWDSNATPIPRQSLDSVLTDKSVQTIMHRYFYAEHLTDDNYDDDSQTCDIPQDVTENFVKDHPEVADSFFTALDGECTLLAKAFGYKNDPAATKKVKNKKRKSRKAHKEEVVDDIKETEDDNSDDGEDIEDTEDDRSEDEDNDQDDDSFIDNSQDNSDEESLQTVSSTSD